MALSPDGKQLLVSATTANNISVIDVQKGVTVAKIPSGDSPHESNFSKDGKTIFHESIGLVYTPTDDPGQDGTKGDRIFELIDAETLKVKRSFDIGKQLAAYGIGASAAIRPMAIAPDERFLYFQLSFLHGFVEYDLQQGRPTRIAVLPLSAESAKLKRTEYLLDSAHHGLAIDPKGTKLCVAGTMSGYVAMVDRKTLKQQRIIPVGPGPYWSTSDSTAATASCRSPAPTRSRCSPTRPRSS